MVRRLSIGAVLGLVLLVTRFASADETSSDLPDRNEFTVVEEGTVTKPYSAGISFRCVKTSAGRMIKMRMDDVLFLVPYVKVPDGGWLSQGELRPLGDRVKWTSASGITSFAAQITLKPLKVQRDSNASAISLQAVKTPSGPMIEIKTLGAVALAPYVKVPRGTELSDAILEMLLHVEVPPAGDREGEIRPTGDQLEWSTKNTRTTFGSVSFETKKSIGALNGGH
jgi:hypothetical protein